MNLSSAIQKIKRSQRYENFFLKKHLEGKKVFVSLYSEEEIHADKSRKAATAVFSLVGNNAPTVIICPGGAYEFISYINEGSDFAKGFNRAGYNVMIVNYRVSENARYPKPMEDLARAVKLARDNAEKYALDKDRIFIIGSSAGGHLCAYYGARYKKFTYIAPDANLRPTGVVLCYPVVSMEYEGHFETRRNLLSRDFTKEECIDKSVELIADESYPPVFFWHCKDDGAVPVSNSLRLNDRLNEVGVKHQMNIYETGGHGCGLAIGKEPEGWFDEMLKFIGNIE